MKKYITLLLFIITILLSNNVFADTSTTTAQVDGSKILERALQKDAINLKGDLAPGDDSKEVYGYKRSTLDLNVKNIIIAENFSTTSESKISIQTDSKTDKKTKTTILNSAIQTKKVNNGVDGDPNLIRTTDKYVKGVLTERYYDTTVGEEKVYRVWKKNIVKDYFDVVLTNVGVPTGLKNTVLKKIVAKKNLKLDKVDLQKGLFTSLGLKKDISSSSSNSELSTKESTTIDRGFSKFLKVDKYLGLINDEDYEIVDLKTKKTVTTLTPVHNMILTVDYVGLANEAIKNKKVKEYSFGMISDTGLTDQEIMQSFEYIYKNLEIFIWIDANNYTIKSFRVDPYEIYLNVGDSIKITSTVSINYREDPTRSTGYIYPTPKTYITPKEIRSMFLKY